MRRFHPGSQTLLPRSHESLLFTFHWTNHLAPLKLKGFDKFTVLSPWKEKTRNSG